MRKWVRFYRIKPMRLKELWKGIKKEREKIEKKEKVEEPRFQTKTNSNLKRIFLILEEGKGIDRERSLVLIRRS